MDANSVVTMIAQLGFPIACCIAMGWYVKYITDKHRDEVSNLNEQHRNEMAQVTEALNNNTLAIQQLCSKLGE